VVPDIAEREFMMSRRPDARLGNMGTVKGAQMATFIRDAQNVIQRDGSHPDWNGEEVHVTIKMWVTLYSKSISATSVVSCFG